MKVPDEFDDGPGDKGRTIHYGDHFSEEAAKTHMYCGAPSKSGAMCTRREKHTELHEARNAYNLAVARWKQ